MVDVLQAPSSAAARRSNGAGREAAGGPRRSGCRRPTAAPDRETGPPRGPRDSFGPWHSTRRARPTRRATPPACARGPCIARNRCGRPWQRTLRSGEYSIAMNVPWLSSIGWPFSFLTVPNFRSVSFSWRKIWPAASAISVCIASSFSSFSPSVCGLKRRMRVSSSLYGASAGDSEELVHLRRRNGENLRAGCSWKPGPARLAIWVKRPCIRW